MRVTTIELAGTSKTKLSGGTPGLPQAFARISRKSGDEFITVEILTAGTERTHKVQADSDDDQWSMAEILKRALDGCRGTRGDVNECYRVIQMFAD